MKPCGNPESQKEKHLCKKPNMEFDLYKVAENLKIEMTLGEALTWSPTV